jgi:hypothetical protein
VGEAIDNPRHWQCQRTAGTPQNVVEVLAGHAANGVHRKVYEPRELLPMSLLWDGLERLTYPAVVKSLE